MKKEKQTVEEFLQKLDYKIYNGDKVKSVVIHPGFHYNFLEVTPEYMEKLKSYMEMKVSLVQADIEEMNPADQLVAMFFEDAF